MLETLDHRLQSKLITLGAVHFKHVFSLFTFRLLFYLAFAKTLQRKCHITPLALEHQESFTTQGFPACQN